jgi:MFS family permease
MPLFMVQLTGRGLDLGLTAAAETIPTLLFGFTAGVFLDRFAIKPILIASDLLRATAFVLLALGAASDTALPWMVFLAAFVVGSLATFFNSGLEAVLPLRRPRRPSRHRQLSPCSGADNGVRPRPRARRSAHIGRGRVSRRLRCQCSNIPRLRLLPRRGPGP